MPLPYSDDILTDYFLSGRSYQQILLRLKLLHGVNRSMSWLKRQLKRLGLRRRQSDHSDSSVRALIQHILQTYDRGSLLGYRAVWRLLRSKYGVVVRRDTVMRLLKQEDPEGVAQRRARRLRRRSYNGKGPNHVWHLDGYDKLAPFGLYIHGCVDGYSRKILWMKLSTTNRDSKVISRYYLECVEQAQGCPTLVRGDYGTENCAVATLQIAFRMNSTDTYSGSRSFIYGPSTANTRIEGLWSQWRRYRCHWWIDLFKSLQADGKFNKLNPIHRHCLLFVFGPLIETDIKDFIDDWNTHPIRSNSHTISPSGRPDDMYQIPELFGAVNEIHDVDPQVWVRGMQESSSKPLLCPNFFEETKDFLSAALGLRYQDISKTNCKDVYVHLINLLMSVA